MNIKKTFLPVIGLLAAFTLSSCEKPHENVLLKPFAQKNLVEQLNQAILKGDVEAIRCTNYFSDLSKKEDPDQKLACGAWRFNVEQIYKYNADRFAEASGSTEDVIVPTYQDWEDAKVWIGIKGKLKPKPVPVQKGKPIPKNYNFFEHSFENFGKK